MVALADSSKRWHIELRCTICGPLGLLFKKKTLWKIELYYYTPWQMQSFVKTLFPTLIQVFKSSIALYS